MADARFFTPKGDERCRFTSWGKGLGIPPLSPYLREAAHAPDLPSPADHNGHLIQYRSSRPDLPKDK